VSVLPNIKTSKGTIHTLKVCVFFAKSYHFKFQEFEEKQPLEKSSLETMKDFRSNMAPGMLGAQTVPRNLRQLYYEKGKLMNDLRLKGSELQNIVDIEPYIEHLVKDSSMFPLLRWTMMYDNCTKMIRDIIKSLKKQKKSAEKKKQDFLEPPLIFHYDTTFNVGKNFVSILSIRDPSKQRRSHSENSRNVFPEPILPCAVLVHQGRRREQHESFISTIMSQFNEATGGAFESKEKILVTDHEFGNIWPGTRTIYCSTHMKKNISEYLRKLGKGSNGQKNPVLHFYEKMINCKEFDCFLKLKSDLEAGKMERGGLGDVRVREYLLKNIVPKIENFSGR